MLRKHVLIMSFIGQDQRPAPKLKEATLTLEEMTTAYHQTMEVSGTHMYMYMWDLQSLLQMFSVREFDCTVP